MDPRPYTYEYRKPRLSNPTYHSQHLYESIYHIGAYGKRFTPIDKNYQLPSQSTYNDLRKVQPKQNHPASKYQPNVPQTERYQEKPQQKIKHNDEKRSEVNSRQHYSLENHKPSSRSQQNNHQLLSNYANHGNRLVQNLPGRDQDLIYQRQEKPYNIVTNYPRQYQPVHRQFPKYSLENNLIQKNLYF